MTEKRSIQAVLGQFPITLDLAGNLRAILTILEEAQPHDLVVLPEGALSGYDENPAFLQALSPEQIDAALELLQGLAQKRGIHLFLGTCLHRADQWFNAGNNLGPQAERFVYHKVNLATGERGFFAEGHSLEPVTLQVGDQEVRVGIQLCRELRYPEQWQHLARQGAQLFVYMTNAVGQAADLPVWRAHLISRAAENQRFNTSEENACPPAWIATDFANVSTGTSVDLAATIRIERPEEETRELAPPNNLIPPVPPSG